MIICFDGDRTLWDLVYDYNDCCNDLKQWMYDEFNFDIPTDIIQTTLNAHLKYENKHNEFHRSIFPLCIMRTFNSLYVYEKGERPPIEPLAKAFRIGDRIYDTAPAPKVNAFTTMDILKEAFPTSPLVLLTAGDRVVQNSKIYATGFDGTFFDTHITKKKDKRFYEDIYRWYLTLADKYGNLVIKEPYECIMIGDSIKHDINPALEAGWVAIYMPTERGDDEEVIECNRLFRADNFVELTEKLFLIRNEINDYKSRQMS